MTEQHPEDAQPEPGPEPEPDLMPQVTMTAEATVTHADGSTD